MHASQRELMQRLLDQFFKTNGLVYDIGSCDINGSHKQDVLDRKLTYVGVDIAPGPNVDLIVEAHTWLPIKDNSCDYVISGSCLEHVQAPWLWAKALERCLKPGGTFAVILPFSIGEHRYPVDCYRILPDGLKFLFTEWTRFCCLECGFSPNNADTYFVGRKYPILVKRGR